MSIHCAALMCHAPIVIPAIGGRRAADCLATTQAMQRTAEALMAHDPDVVVVISPHTRRAATAWGIVEGDRLVGNFSRFGAPDTRIDLPNAHRAADAIHEAAKHIGCSTVPLPHEPLDHGAMVPLHFVVQAGWNGPTVVIALPWRRPDPDAMGLAIRNAANVSGQRWVVLASGDMSHRLIPGAPAGYHPRAREFDAAYAAEITAGHLRGASAIDADLREIAAEDVVDSVAVASAAVEWQAVGHQKFSYEAPFGVGYLEAILYTDQATA